MTLSGRWKKANDFSGNAIDAAVTVENDAITAGNGAVVTRGRLVIEKMTADDAGLYTCEAQNRKGFAFAKPNAFVTVTKQDCKAPKGEERRET